MEARFQWVKVHSGREDGRSSPGNDPGQSLDNGDRPPPFITLPSMTELSPKPPLPDHLSIDPRSPHHVAAIFEHGIGIRINGKERFDVEEYCLSEGWIKVPAGRALDRRGQPLLVKLKGRVEAFYR